MIIILTYCMIWYSITYFFPPCENLYFDSDSICMWPCLWIIQWFALYELFANMFGPIVLIVIFSLSLLVRVIWMKSRMRQGNQWRRNLKMAIQLFSIISVYILFVAPDILLVILYRLIGPLPMFDVIDTYLYFISVFPMFINPFICVFSSNELRVRLFEILRCRTRRSHPVATITVETKLRTLPVVGQ